MTPSIRRRLLFVLVPAVVVVWLFSAVFSYFDARNEVHTLLDNQLEHSGQVLLTVSQHELLEQRLLGGNSGSVEVVPHKLLSGGLEGGHKLTFQVWINRDVLAMRSENAPLSPISKQVNGFSEVALGADAWRAYSAQSEDGLIRVHVADRMDARRSFTSSIVWRTMIPLVICLPLLAITVWFGVGVGTAPLQRMAAEIAEWKPNKIQPVDETNIPIEALPLTRAVNTIFGQLKAAFDTERRFTSDAAHELRTPLAALKTHAEVALSAQNDEERQLALRQVARGVNRATHMIEQLLTLARLDPDTGLTNTRRVDLFIIAENIISDEAPLALDKNIEISLNGTRGKFIDANGDAIGVLIRNLVDNAIRYTPENGEVEVKISQVDNQILLSVADSGPGIPADERELVFKRFYRRLGTKAPGSGLGLSIVRRIASLHGLELVLLESRLGGLQIDVHFLAAENIDPLVARVH